MKFKSVFLTLILAASFNGIFAADINSNVLYSFQKEFAKAENIQWTVTGQLTRATFTLNGKTLFAYYNESGERYALASNTALAEMPAKLMQDVKSYYKQYWITEAFHMAKENENAYYMVIENADKKIVLKSWANESWIQVKVSAKD